MSFFEGAAEIQAQVIANRLKAGNRAGAPHAARGKDRAAVDKAARLAYLPDSVANGIVAARANGTLPS